MDKLPDFWVTQDGLFSIPADYTTDGEFKPDYSIPSLDIVMPVDDWFSQEKGIYSNPQQRGTDWERPCQITIHTKTNAASPASSFSRSAGVRIRGCTSREPNRTKKHSLTLKFRNIYGGALHYPVFGKKPANYFKTLILDATANNSWTDTLEKNNARAQFIRNQYCSDLQLQMGWPSVHGRYVHLFLNGIYWGLYCLRERPDQNWCESYYGGKSRNYDVIKNTCVGIECQSGDLEAWNTMFASIKDYDQAKRHLNINNFIDYILLNQYVGNTDWAVHNWYAVRHRTRKNARFTFVSWDAELVMLDLNTNVTGNFDRNSPTEIHEFLLNNEKYQKRFVERAWNHFNTGIFMYPDKPYTARAIEVEKAIPMESARWGDAVNPERRYSHIDWSTEMRWLLTEYFPKRKTVVIEQLKVRQLYFDKKELTAPGGL